MGFVSADWLKQHNLVTFRDNSTKFSDKVHILLLNNCVQFHAKKSVRIAQISTEVTAAYFVLDHSL